jgi:hypothetical protein
MDYLKYNKNQFVELINHRLTEFETLDWKYGPLNPYFKFVYVIDIYNIIINYLERGLEHFEIPFKNLIIKTIVRNENEVLMCNTIIKYNEIIVKSFGIIRMRYFKNYIRIHSNIGSKNLSEYLFMYESDIKRYNPIYTMLTHKKHSKVLNRFPIELLRLLNEY